MTSEPARRVLRAIRSAAGRAARGILPRGREPGVTGNRAVRYVPAKAGAVRWPAAATGVEVVSGGGPGRAELESWCARQTLARRRGIRVVGEPGASGWFFAPTGLPDVAGAWLESCLLVAAAEEVDAVAIVDQPQAVASWRDLTAPPWRSSTLFSAAAFRLADGQVTRRDEDHAPLVKVLDRRWGGEAESGPTAAVAGRVGAYRTARESGAELRVGVRDAAVALTAAAPLERDQRVPVLVLAPFLATGGAEHTLYETLALLTGELDLTIATLAPHAPERGDRRDDFRRLTPRLFCLGDLVHPAAMEGVLDHLLETSGAEIVYNANGTTLFYELAPRLKARRPGLRVLDHLYDHRIGYIEWYTPATRDAVDVCIAENRRIAATLVEEHGWPPDRVPVIWPCGRPPDALPPVAERAAVRRQVRAELGLADDAVVFVTAARMHEQKRPLDLVALAERVRDLPDVRFLVVGGGPLEGEVDAAIAAAPGAPIRRLPFRDDIPRLLAAADVGCLVSSYEGLPVFLLECLQLGLPFLGTDVGDLGEVLRETGAGVVVATPGDLEALETAVRRLADPSLRSELAGRAAAAGPRFEPAACAAAYRAAILCD